jgi:hypothetical protein
MSLTNILRKWLSIPCGLVFLIGGHAVANESHSSGMSSVMPFMWNIFSHADIQSSSARSSQSRYHNFVLGETAIFLAANPKDRITVLYEGTYQPKRYRQDTYKSERWQVRYDISGTQYLIVGKNHTPVNHWNDSYHHGRLFYPSVNRPLSLDRFIPLHDSGIRFGDRAVFETGFFYDLAIGSGHRHEDRLFPKGILSQTLSFGFKSISGNIFRVGWHRNLAPQGSGYTIPESSVDDGFFSAGIRSQSTPSDKAEDLRILAASVNIMSEKFSWVTEAARSEDRHNNARSHAFYQLVGLRLSYDSMPYVLFDWISQDDAMSTRSRVESRLGIGLKQTVSDTADLKLELVHRRNGMYDSNIKGLEFQAQISFSIK